MKHIKLYEYFEKDKNELLDTLKVGDYVIVNPEFLNDLVLQTQLRNNIGKVTDINYDEEFPIVVQYSKNIELSSALAPHPDNKIEFDKEEILYWARSKKELELMNVANKYNL